MNHTFRTILMTSFILGMLFSALPQGDVAAAPAFTPPPDDFIITVDTTLYGGSNPNQFTIPTYGVIGYDFNVDCDNNGTDEVVGATSSYTCTYGAGGTYTVRISSNDPSGNGFHRVNFGTAFSDTLKLLTVEQWGSTEWSSMATAFKGAENLTITATDTPDLSAATSTSHMFEGATSLNQDISAWDVSHIIDMSGMFYEASAFNQPLNTWDVSSVANMSHMFYGASAFDQPLYNWNTANVQYMTSMFEDAASFNQGLTAWDTSGVELMSGMFKNAAAFNGSLTAWDTSSVTTMEEMFRAAAAFNQPLNNWDTGSVTTMRYMFTAASAFNQPLDNWDTSAVTDMSFMFATASSFNGSINNWDVSQVTEMTSMFSNAVAFNQPLGTWNTANVTTMEAMFANAAAFDQALNAWDTSGVTIMRNMFSGADAFNQSLSAWVTSGVTDLSGMFSGAAAFNQDLSAWNTASVTTMEEMFLDATAFNQDLSAWDTGNVANMDSLFRNATIFDQNLGSWDVTSLTSAALMFDNVRLATSNYDSLLIGWQAQSAGLQSSVSFSGGDSNYCEASSERQYLINTRSWTITDAGQNCFLDVPTLLSPADTSSTFDLTPKFEWESVLDADGYSILYADNIGLSGATMVNVTGTTYTPTTELTEGDWYWRVWATSTNSAYFATSSDVWSFTIAEGAMSQPVLLTPANGSTTTDLTPTFDWEDVPGATGYTLRLADNPEGTGAITTTVTASTFTPVSDRALGTYYWRVKATNATAESGWSDTWTFTIVQNVDVPTQIAPTEGSEVGNIGVVYSWDTVTDADKYTLEVVRVSDSSVIHSARYNASAKCDVSTCTVALSDTLEFTDYKWRIRAWIGDYGSDWTNYITFSTTLDEITLRSPGVDAAVYGGRPTFKWYQNLDAASYIIEFYDATSGSDVLIESWQKNPVCDPYCEYRIPNTMDLGTAYGDYRWRIRAKNGVLEGPWSELRTFSYTELERTAQVSPENGFNSLTTTPTFEWTEITGATMYLFQVRLPDDTLVGNFLVEDAVYCTDGGNCTWTFPDPDVFEVGEEYKWHVRAKNGRNFGRWTAYREIYFPLN